MKKILLAGGAGYIGTELCKRLMKLDYSVTVIDDLWFGNHLDPKVQLIKKDLFQVSHTELKGYDTVIFLAGVSNDPMAEFSPSENFIQNAACPAYLAYESKRAGVKRFIYASSCSVYGYTVDELYDESAPTTCGYPYGISKLQGENGVMQLVDKSFSGISLRQGTVCGYSDRMRFDLVVNTMFKNAITKGEITVNNPSIWRPIYHIQDACSAFIRAIQAPENISGVFNVASDNYTLGQIGDIVSVEMSKNLNKEIKMHINDMQDFRNYKVSTKHAKNTLGFTPVYGIKDIINQLFEKASSFTNFEDDNYYNIRVFEGLGKK
ncbi:MAG: SDR family oxidoreductase [Bacteroidetes bacterium]|nr:SDR family oxidoreductase [Bacteroidota bacterium]